MVCLAPLKTKKQNLSSNDVQFLYPLQLCLFVRSKVFLKSELIKKQFTFAKFYNCSHLCYLYAVLSQSHVSQHTLPGGKNVPA